MCEVNPEHRKNARMENGAKAIYLRLLKALYDCMESALLWYDLYAKTIKSQGLVFNEYDRWTSNITIEGNRCMIDCYVDSNKVLHIDEHKHKDNWGDSRTFWWTHRIKIYGNGHRVLRNWRVSLFTKDIVANIIWVAKRGRPEIEPDISFLCTRVTNSTVDYKEKFKCVLQSRKKGINDKRVMGEEKLSQLRTWVDATYRVQPNLNIHTSDGMSFGYGLVHYKSSKKELNEKRSTKAKVVWVIDYLPYTIWIFLFMESHGYEIKQNIKFQDNHNAIRTEKNGKKSCTGKYRHIYIRYLFVKDRVDSNNM